MRLVGRHSAAGVDPLVDRSVLEPVGKHTGDARGGTTSAGGRTSDHQGWERRYLSRLSGTLIDGAILVTPTVVDAHIEQKGDLAGLIIEVTAFPGWESLGAMASHFRFVRDHHMHIKKIGVVTDSPMGTVAEHLASHFVAAEIRHFPAGEIEAARQWVMNQTRREDPRLGVIE